MFNRSYADPYVIAEIGVNHEGSLERAKAMINSIAEAGGHAAKFQTYKASTLASLKSSPAYWDLEKEATRSQYELFQRFDGFGADDYEELAEFCANAGLDFLSTPFDVESLAFLSPLMPAVKVASADITNVPLLRAVAKTGKPVILSTGASSHGEIDSALKLLESHGVDEIALLHCVLNYPTANEKANLLGIERLTSRFGSRATIGYSDHVAPSSDGSVPALEIAVIMGARILEKHFTDDRTAPGNDHYHAFDAAGLKELLRKVALIRVMAGDGVPDLLGQRNAINNARRRIFSTRDISRGEFILESDCIPLRANTGIEVVSWDHVVGARLRQGKHAGEPFYEEDLG